MRHQPLRHEPDWQHKTTKQILMILVSHLPVLAFAAFQFDSGVLLSLGLGVLILLGPALAYATAPGSRFCAVMLGVGSMGLSGLLIHLGHGMIEMHFHIFVMLAVLILLSDVWALVAAAATIAAHHILFWLVLPASVFNYQAGFSIVLLHAVFVVAETGPACYVAFRFRKARNAEEITREQLPSAARAIASTTGQVAALSARIAAHAQDQRAMSEETLAAAVQINASAKTSTGHAESSALLVEEIFGTILGEAHRKSEEVTNSMGKIRQANARINNFLETIDRISFQTTLLALNAAIEAARAGDAGLGFSVVADEVGALARRCAEASTDTRDLIEEAVRESAEGASQMATLGVLIDGIMTRTGKFRESFQTILTGGREQSRSIEQIAENQKHLDTTTEQLAQIAQQSADFSGSLSDRAGELENLVAMLH